MQAFLGGRRPLAVLAAVVVAAAVFLYLRGLREDAWVPPGPAQEAGRILFERKRCVRCHRVAGVGGLAGPDLTAVGARRSASWMEAYLRDPRAVEPEAEMPRPRITAEQRAALVAYLGTLDESEPAPPGSAPGNR